MPETLGHYRLLDRLGRGAIGDVYRARDTRVGRTVAVRVVTPELAGNPSLRERFLSAAHAAAAISHPGIAELYEVGSEAGVDFLVCEFVAGDRLSAIMGGRPLNARRAVGLAAQIADALAELHAAGFVHGDLHPDNVRVTPRGHAKLLEAGLAWWTEGGAARATGAAPSPASPSGPGAPGDRAPYRAPEERQGEAAAAPADVFSLGVMLVEMLAGTRPPAGARDEHRAPSGTDSGATELGLPSGLDALVGRTLAQNPEDRPSDPALAAELRAVAARLDAGTAGAAPAVLASRRATSGFLIWVVVALAALALAALLWLV
jgi:serine/threonine protein kinase